MKELFDREISRLSDNEIIEIITEYPKSLWGLFINNGIKDTERNFDRLVDYVQTRLEGSQHIIRKWSSDEYNNFVLFYRNK